MVSTSRVSTVPRPCSPRGFAAPAAHTRLRCAATPKARATAGPSATPTCMRVNSSSVSTASSPTAIHRYFNTRASWSSARVCARCSLQSRSRRTWRSSWGRLRSSRCRRLGFCFSGRAAASERRGRPWSFAGPIHLT
eukprot:5127907-Prymnesium_polylepis.1